MPATYTSTRFVGREDAFARLAGVLQSAADGASGTLLIDGTAGVGTTRFIDEAVRRVSGLHEPMAVLRGGAFGPGTDAPYQPVIRALRPTLAGLPDDDLGHVLGTAADELVQLMPELAERVGAPGTAGRRIFTAVPERRQARLLEAVLGVVGRLGERQPVLLIVEDLHRADAGTRALLTFLARIARSHRLAIVGTYQADAIRREDPWAIDLVGLAAAPRPPARLTLAPLGRDELARLIEAIETIPTVGERAGRGGRAVGWPPARRRGAPGGAARAARRVAHVVVPGPGPRPDRRPVP